VSRYDKDAALHQTSWSAFLLCLAPVLVVLPTTVAIIYSLQSALKYVDNNVAFFYSPLM